VVLLFLVKIRHPEKLIINCLVFPHQISQSFDPLKDHIYFTPDENKTKRKKEKNKNEKEIGKIKKKK